jgi:hypothetical protein
MNISTSSFCADGYMRLITTAWYRRRQKEIHEKVQAQYQKEFSEARSYWQRMALKCKTRKEIERQLVSPYALW